MKEWNGILDETLYTNIYNGYNWEGSILFDIETTGFSPNNTMLYMIGYCYHRDNQWNYRIFFNDDGRSEYNIICQFLAELSGFQTMIHFNGDGFDIPYLAEKCRQYHSLGLTVPNADALEYTNSIDLYKLIKPFRNGLGFENLKLKTIERALGIQRKDTYNGGELIQVYHTFLQNPSEHAEQLLYQHNYEDILAMIPMLQLLSFQGISEHDWVIGTPIISDEAVTLPITLLRTLPLHYDYVTPYFAFHAYGTEALAQIPLLEGVLKYFFADWKNYYYLPYEDKAIHKSLATYVDSSSREKAKKATAYTKKEGRFFAFPSDFADETIHLYKMDCKDNICYADIEETDIHNIDFWSGYLSHIF